MPVRSTTVTPRLQRSMIRDTTTAVLTTPRALVIWAIVLLLLVAGVVLAARGALGDAPLLLIGPVVFIVVFPLLSRRSVRRSITTALPVGATVAAELRGRSLHLETPSGVHDVALTAYRKVLEKPSVVLLHLRGSQILTALPREVFGPDDVGALRAAVEGSVSAP